MAIIANASGEYLLRTANLPSDSSWTGMCWVYFNSIRASAYQYFIALENATTSATAGHLIGFDTAGSLHIYNGTGWGFGSNPSTGAWYHIYIRNNGTNFSGGFRQFGATSYTTASIGASAAFTEAALFFGNDSWDEYMDCRLAGIKVWDAHLTDAEIEKEFQSLMPERTADLNIWTPGILTGTDRVKDWSGNGRDWTAGGTLTDGDGPPVPWGAPPVFLNKIIVTAQYARPASGVSAGTWTASSGSDLYAMIDETSANDSDYIVTTGASTCEVALGSLTDPASSSGHIVRYRISATSGGITVRLRQGTTTIATWAHAPAPTSLTTYAQTLTSGEADSITDYTALRLQFEATT